MTHQPKRKLSIEALEARLNEAESTLAALRRGEVDLLIGDAAAYVLRIKELEEELESKARQWQTVFDAVSDSVMLLDGSFSIVRCNRATLTMFGKTDTPDSIVGRHCWDVVCGSGKPIDDCPLLRMKVSRKRESLRLEQNDHQFQISVDPIFNEAGELTGVVHLVSDVTEQVQLERDRLKLEAQVRQLQKMDTIGQLAGGIAHDFNNMLVPILGYAELGMRQVPEDNKYYHNFEKIKEAAERAANLTRQILAFSRKQLLSIEIVNLNKIAEGFRKMLQRIIGEDIELELHLMPDLHAVRADPAQLEQVFLNLAVNARDAMPTGGRLTIETANAVLDEAYAAHHPGAEPGQYVMLAVSDTGVGMTQEVQQRVFEPFFTTKPAGHGTGLGLSTVFGIVKQHGGNIWVYSEPGQGATFKIYLPAVDVEAETMATAQSESAQLTGAETIMVVEDEPGVRQLTIETLQASGYHVLEAASAAEGLRIIETHDGTIDLLLTDVVMPDISGWELYQKLQSIRPDMRVLFMSGYTDDVVVRHGILTNDVQFVQKPFPVTKLLQKIRDALA